MDTKLPSGLVPVTSLQQDAIKVFFDGGCPLCSREIAHYRRLKGADTVNWVDIRQREDELYSHGLTLNQAMSRFHVLDRKGNWQTGAYGFIEMWEQLPAYRWLSRLLRRLYLVPLLDFAYGHFARWRLKRSCDENTCL